MEDNRIKNHQKLLPFLLLLLACSYWITPQYVHGQTDFTQEKLQAANEAIGQAFNSISDAEKAGANVTSLIIQLNGAADLLAQAENSYRTGDFNIASVKADGVLPIAQQVTMAAKDAKQAALDSSQQLFWLTISFTIIGIIVLVLVLYAAWRFLKRRYIQNLYTAKPEVTNQ